MSLAVFPKIQRRRLAVALTLLVLPVVLVLTLFLRPPAPVAAAAAGAPDCEPRLPLDVAWRATDDDPSRPGTSLTLILSAKSDLPSVRVELLLPENATILSGTEEFRSALGRGEETRLALRVSSRGAAKLQARVTAVTPGGMVFRRGATLDLGEDGRPVVQRDPGLLRRATDGGRQVREFPAAGQEVAP